MERGEARRGDVRHARRGQAGAATSSQASLSASTDGPSAPTPATVAVSRHVAGISTVVSWARRRPSSATSSSPPPSAVGSAVGSVTASPPSAAVALSPPWSVVFVAFAARAIPSASMSQGAETSVRQIFSSGCAASKRVNCHL